MTLVEFVNWLLAHSFALHYLQAHHLIFLALRIWTSSGSVGEFVARMLRLIFGS